MVVRVATGLFLALLACFIGLMTAGGGHGWRAPLVWSFPLIIIWPLVLVRDISPTRRWIVLDAALLVLAALLDIAIVQDLISFASVRLPRATQPIIPGVDRSILPFFLVWILIWIGWQLLAARTLLRDLTGTKA